ncbi:stage II sporulation protein M [Candidatus Contubernalis alkaliaceticus]|uniref:stage II sporulation protein M n=1 Tax=Candidatus Contubernalis alkaliaceticus TaxID=338645 RepID=UPI001F4BD723|nr:stage II sporulation protein M [Candidatus Contubernalis alkalaceticus]UNC92530.1 stage II sporulation protein M [Candidatus Contubernalis alkalaceticus]
MYYRLKDLFYQYIKENLVYYILVVFLFFVGIIVGALVVKTIPSAQIEELNRHLSYYFVGFNKDNFLENQYILRESLGQNFKNLLMIWLLGSSIVGFPIIFFLLFLRGFVLGFTVGFLVDQIAVKGMFFAVVAILPHNIFIIPAMIIAGVTSVSFAFKIIKLRLGGRKFNFGQLFMSYSFTILLMGFLIITAGLIEAYITPVFIQFVIPLINM